MKVETRWDVGNEVWAVLRDYQEFDETCLSCNGEGGALIPGTKIRVECQDCEGKGQTTDRREVYWARRVTIGSVEVRAGFGVMEAYRVSYQHRVYLGVRPIFQVCESEEEAKAIAEKYSQPTESTR